MKNLFISHIACLLIFASCSAGSNVNEELIVETLEHHIFDLAKKNLCEEVIPITDFYCQRSMGGRNDFYSEGDYWWPDTLDLSNPYIRRDGITNPNNFTEHRLAMIRFSSIVGNLCSAYLLSKDEEYVIVARRHIKSWLIDDSTKMNPNMLYAQAIKGLHTGRGIGIIDAIHLMEVAQAVCVFESHNVIPSDELEQIKAWFNLFVVWLTTHPYGQSEMIHPNNHGTCWNMQVAIFARLAENKDAFEFCQNRFVDQILPKQMAINGSFPLELARTKPYGYSLFNLDAIVMNALILSDDKMNMWNYTLEDGRNVKKGLDFLTPYVKDKADWPYSTDVMYWENWPVAQPSFVFGALVYNNVEYLKLWQTNRHDLKQQEVIRNVPIRNPLIWLDLLR